MAEQLNQKFEQVLDYFDFIKLSRCLELLQEEGFEPYDVGELKEIAKEHFHGILEDLNADNDLTWIRRSGDHLELVYHDGDLELSAILVHSDSDEDCYEGESGSY